MKVLVSLKENLNKMRMIEDTKDDFDIQVEEYEEVVKKFKSKNRKCYDFLTKADENYQAAVGAFVRRMIKEEEFPQEFRKTTLQMLCKGKGPAEVLKKIRFLHLKSFLPMPVSGEQQCLPGGWSAWPLDR